MRKTTKKQQKKQKKLRTLVLLLFLTIIMFGTSTYAWFTANKTVTINSLDVHVEASGGIQISTDAATWKSVITNSDITTNAYTGHKNMVPGSVTAVSTNGAVDSAEGTTKGQLMLYKATIGNDATTGDYTITTTRTTEQAGTTGDYIAFDIFLRVDEARTIYLTTGSSVTVKATTEDKGLKNAARVGFVNLGNAASTTDPATLVALNNPAASAVIWEPNIDTHSALVTSQVATEYGVTLGTGSNATPYYGIKEAFSSPANLKNTVNGTDQTHTTSMTPYIKTVNGFTTYQQAFSLAAGVTKMRVYMWIEGQDIDCENNATGSDITYTVQLSTESSAAGGTNP